MGKGYLILIILVFFFFYLPAQPLNKYAEFYHIKIPGGIERNSISWIAQDSSGQMWFATKDGLVRYNGKNMIVYKLEKAVNGGIPDNFVNIVFVDRNGRIWCGTQKGAAKYNPSFDRFSAIQLKEGYVADINSICQDTSGNLWFLDITSNNVIRLNPENEHEVAFFHWRGSERFVRMYVTSDNRFYILTTGTFMLEFFPDTGVFRKTELLCSEEAERMPHLKNYLSVIVQDTSGRIYIGTNLGFVLIYEPKSEGLSKLFYKSASGIKGYTYLMSMLLDGNVLWIGTWFDGLYKVYLKNGVSEHYMPQSSNLSSLSNDIVTSLYKDKAGFLWVGTEFAGLNIMQKSKRFKILSHNTKGFEKLPSRPYYSADFDAQGNIFVGTDMAGLYEISLKDGLKIKKISIAKRVFAVYYDTLLRVLWLGTDSGLVEYDPYGKTERFFYYDRNNYNSPGGKNIISLCKDIEGNLWLGSIRGGLTKYDIQSQRFYRFTKDDKANGFWLNDNYISSIVCDSFGNVWIATASGLNKFNTRTGTFVIFKHRKNSNNSLSSNRINALFYSGDKLWIGSDGGLDYYDFKTEKIRHVNLASGSMSGTVKAITGDKNSRLWITTTRNLWCLNYDGKIIYSFGKSDGLGNRMYIKDFGFQDFEFQENFASCSSSGELCFGGLTGFIVFNPDSLPVNQYLAPVIIDYLKVNGKKVFLKDNIITLKPYMNHLEISLSVLNFIQPEKNRYAYYLENYDTAWHFEGSVARYYDLKPGTYVFKYKGGNNDGVWNNQVKQLRIIILPYFYQTAKFKWIVFILLVIMIVFLFLYKQLVLYFVKRKREMLRYSGSKLTEHQLTEINKRMIIALEKDKLYLDPSLTLQKLAKSINTLPNYLSQVINTKYNRNFRNLINHYRIEEAKRFLSGSDLKIEAIAYECGFNTVSTFNVIFKKLTGYTPSEYRKVSRQ